jgi:hypothetical protein
VPGIAAGAGDLTEASRFLFSTGCDSSWMLDRGGQHGWRHPCRRICGCALFAPLKRKA